jgi:hypothetical protein
VRRGERDGDADDGDQSGDRNAGDFELSEYTHELCELRGGSVAERSGTGDDNDLERIDDGVDTDSQLGTDGFGGVFGEVLVRGELRNAKRARTLSEDLISILGKL